MECPCFLLGRFFCTLERCPVACPAALSSGNEIACNGKKKKKKESRLVFLFFSPQSQAIVCISSGSLMKFLCSYSSFTITSCCTEWQNLSCLFFSNSVVFFCTAHFTRIPRRMLAFNMETTVYDNIWHISIPVCVRILHQSEYYHSMRHCMWLGSGVQVEDV